MRFFRTEVWSYAILLIILFAIATVAVWETISYLNELLDKAGQGGEINTVIIVMWALTLGFMFIAGAFGLWAIKFSAEAESRRRIGRFVEGMEFFRDGLLAVDRKGRISGSNPAIKKMTGLSVETTDSLGAACPSLSEEDIRLLLDPKEPNEVERSVLGNSGESRTIRFRSQPSGDLSLIMVSDVTAMNSQRLRNRQVAKLQLVGQLARGAAHDFNSLLCGVSGYTSLLNRLQPGSPEMAKCVDAIRQNVEKGLELTSHLSQLGQSEPPLSSSFTEDLDMHVRTASDILRDSLPVGWQVESSSQEDFPVIGFTGQQLEQIILNLGLLAADAAPGPAKLKIAAGRPGSTHSFTMGDNRYAGILIVTATQSDLDTIANPPQPRKSEAEGGLILSILRSMIEDAEGRLECLTGIDGAPVYRVALPHGTIAKDDGSIAELPPEVKHYIAQWAILLAGAGKDYGLLAKSFQALGSRVERVDNIVSVLARVEDEKPLDVMVLSRNLLGQESKALLKAILKLRPAAGVVVLCEQPAQEPADLLSDVVFLPNRSDLNKILTLMLEARSLASKRKSPPIHPH